MQATTPVIRQSMGCGYLPLTPGARPWTPARGASPTWCPGYTTTLPEVIEVARARFHHDKGALRDWCGEDVATEPLLAGIEILAGSIGECSDYYMTPADKGGGGS